MPADLTRLIIPSIITLVVIWGYYRIGRRIKKLIQDEIYKNFPAIKDTIVGFERRIDYLKAQVETLERKIEKMDGKKQAGN